MGETRRERKIEPEGRKGRGNVMENSCEDKGGEVEDGNDNERKMEIKGEGEEEGGREGAIWRTVRLGIERCD